jgi:hypothetical protein
MPKTSPDASVAKSSSAYETATYGTSLPSTISSDVVGSDSICSYVPASRSPTRLVAVTERQRFVSSMPASAARKNVRSRSVGLNQKPLPHVDRRRRVRRSRRVRAAGRPPPVCAT